MKFRWKEISSWIDLEDGDLAIFEDDEGDVLTGVLDLSVFGEGWGRVDIGDHNFYEVNLADLVVAWRPVPVVGSGGDLTEALEKAERVVQILKEN